MLVNQIIDAKAIAYSATEVASNAIPYLGLQFFPEDKKEGLDLAWIKTSKGLPVTLAAANFDAIPSLRARDGLTKEKTQMAFFREQMLVSETDEQDIARINDMNDPYLSAAVRAIYDDTNTLLESARVVPEIMRMSLLSAVGGNLAITLASDGVTYSYNYDPDGTWKAKHYQKNTDNTDKWTDATNSTPLTDLENAKKALKKIGKNASIALMNSNTFANLKASAQVRNCILAQNTTANIYMSDAIVISAVKAATGLDIVIYDKMYKDYSGNEKYFYPNNMVTVMGTEKYGKTWFGTTPEERTARQVADVDVAMYNKGIAVAVKTVYGPPASTTITASEIVLPSFEGMDGIFVIETV